MGRGFGGWKNGGNFGWKMMLKKLKNRHGNEYEEGL